MHRRHRERRHDLYKTTVHRQVFAFADLKTLMARATPLRSGDQLAGIAAGSDLERVAAQMVLAAIAPGLTPEMAAAVSKIMRNQDLILAARKCRVVTRFRNTIGRPASAGSVCGRWPRPVPTWRRSTA